MKILFSTLMTLLLAVPLLADQSVEEDAVATLRIGPIITSAGAAVTDLTEASGSIDAISLYKPGSGGTATDITGTTTLAHAGNGMYTLTLTTTDTATPGEAKVVIADDDAAAFLSESLDVHIVQPDVYKLMVDGTASVSTDQSIVDQFWGDVNNTIDSLTFKQAVSVLLAAAAGDRTIVDGITRFFAVDDNEQVRITSDATAGGVRTVTITITDPD